METKYEMALEFPDLHLQLLGERKNKRIQRTETIHKKRLDRIKRVMKWEISLGVDYVGNGKWIKVALETPKRQSSCRCCCNPRKHHKSKDKLTLQERSYEARIQSEMRDLWNCEDLPCAL